MTNNQVLIGVLIHRLLDNLELLQPDWSRLKDLEVLQVIELLKYPLMFPP